MSLANSVEIDVNESVMPPEKNRRAATGSEPATLTDIYQEDVNIAIWERQLPQSLQNTVNTFLAEKPTFQLSITASHQNVLDDLNQAFGDDQYAELSENIAELVDMFCCLFDLAQVGLRMAVLDRAMCPKFHVDRVPCRLITTYQGIATEWLSHVVVDRSKLGAGCGGLSDSESGIYRQHSDIQQLNSGDVALLKGENWQDNENAGLVHRSPAINNDHRLLLTLDFA